MWKIDWKIHAAIAFLYSFVVMFIGWSLSLAFAHPHKNEGVFVYSVEVKEVIDGDTVDVDIFLAPDLVWTDQRLRFLCVNAPETKGASRADGERVEALVRGWLESNPVGVIETVGQDAFGRWLVYLIPDGWEQSVSHMLYQTGNAAIYGRSARARADCEETLAK